MLRYSLRELVRNPRRTLASVCGVALGVGLFTSISLFIDTSASTMTSRAVAPVAVDMAAGLVSPLASTLSLREKADAASLAPGQTTTVTLTVTNHGSRAARDVVVRDEPLPQLTGAPGTTKLQGQFVPDDETGQSPLVGGLKIGDLGPQGSATVTFSVRANAAVPAIQSLAFHGSVVSREEPAPSKANIPQALRLEELLYQVKRLADLSAVDRLVILDLPAGSLQAGSTPLKGPVRLFAFDRSYLAHYPSVAMHQGGLVEGSAVLSAEASRGTRAGVGATVNLLVPGRTDPIQLPVSGVADLSNAEPLFASRNPDNPGEFIYVPNSIIVSPQLFDDVIAPALRVDAASQTPVLQAHPPLLEVDVRIDRSQLGANPASALIRSEGTRRSIERIAPGQITVVDAVSAALTIAKKDAVVAKVLFLFLGLPGVLLAAFLSAYAGSLLAEAQRREHALLRTRGAQSGHLLTLLVYAIAEVATIGSVLGLMLGALTVMLVLGPDALAHAAPQDLLLSAALGIGAGVVATALALFVPGRQALRREVAEERRELSSSRRPGWLLFRVDLVLLAVAGLVELILYLAGGFTPTQTEGQAVSLSFYLLLAPMMAWIGATLLLVRLMLMAVWRQPVVGSARMGSVVRGALRRSVLRRPGALASGIIGAALVVALGTNVAIFRATYDAEQKEDARYTVGSDMRVTPSAATPQTADYGGRLQVPGVTAVTPLVFRAMGAIVGGDKKDLAVVDAPSLARTADLRDSFFLDGSTAQAVAALRSDPSAVLIDSEMARDSDIKVGDPIKVQLVDLGGRELETSLRVVGRFGHFPGFPQHVDLVGNLTHYQGLTGRKNVDFFLVRTADSGATGITNSERALREGPGKEVPLRIQSTLNAIDKDQTTLAALNLRGLGSLITLYTLLMGAAAVGIFVFGLLLQRRKEYVTLRALGAAMSQIRTLVIGEASLVAMIGLAFGVLVGSLMALMFVQILRPLFTLPPAGLSIPVGRLALLLALVSGSMLLSALVATGILHRLRPMELLREE